MQRCTGHHHRAGARCGSDRRHRRGVAERSCALAGDLAAVSRKRLKIGTLPLLSGRGGEAINTSARRLTLRSGSLLAHMFTGAARNE